MMQNSPAMCLEMGRIFESPSALQVVFNVKLPSTSSWTQVAAAATCSSVVCDSLSAWLSL